MPASANPIADGNNRCLVRDCLALRVFVDLKVARSSTAFACLVPRNDLSPPCPWRVVPNDMLVDAKARSPSKKPNPLLQLGSGFVNGRWHERPHGDGNGSPARRRSLPRNKRFERQSVHPALTARTTRRRPALRLRQVGERFRRPSRDCRSYFGGSFRGSVSCQDMIPCFMRTSPLTRLWDAGTSSAARARTSLHT